MTTSTVATNQLTKQQRDELVESVRPFMHRQARIYHRKYGQRKGIPYDEFLSACQLAVVKASRSYRDNGGSVFCSWAGRLMCQHSMHLVRWWGREANRVLFSDCMYDVSMEEPEGKLVTKEEVDNLVNELMAAIRFEFGDQQASAFYEYYAERKPLGELRNRYGHCFNVKNTVRRMLTCASAWMEHRNINEEILT